MQNSAPLGGSPETTRQQGLLEKLPNFLPHPVAMVFLMTLLAILLVFGVSGKGFESLIQFWGEGFVANFGFGMQFVLLLILSYAIAITPIFQGFLRLLAALPKTQSQAVVLLSVFSILLAWFNWALGIIAGVFLAREIAGHAARRKQAVCFPLLIAAGIAGVLVWESGLSGNVLLHLTQGNHYLVEETGLLLLRQTAFSGLNLAVTGMLLVAIPLVLVLVGRQAPTKMYKPATPATKAKQDDGAEEVTLAVRMEKSWALSLVFGGLAVLYVVRHLVAGQPMDMPTYLFMLIALGIFLRKEAMSYQRDVLKSVQVSWVFYIPIVFYGAIQGVVALSGAGDVFAGWLASVGASVFPLVTLLSAALVNLLIPHAGSQWLVEGGSLIKAAGALGISNVKTVLAFCYGAGWTKLLMVSLFAPLLGIEDVKISGMAKYLVVMLLASLAIFVLAVALIPA